MRSSRRGFNIKEPDTDIIAASLQKSLASAYFVVYAPTLFAERVSPTPPGGEAATIHALIKDVLWPMARASIKHPVMNRVRPRAQSPIIPYRILLCPLDAKNHALGFAAALRRHDQTPFADEDLQRLTAGIAELTQSLTERLDPATHLLLRPAFEAEVALRSGGKNFACVVYANLDQVHVVNEMSGFAVGDQVIREVARYWQAQLGLTGSIATHLSGDRFAAVLFGHTLNQASHWADKTREGIAALDGERLPTRVTASLGVAVLSDAQSFQHALAAAETACRVAKERGRNRVELYVTGDHTVMRRHEQVRESREVLDALETDRLSLYAQPIVRFADLQRVNHYEILLRVRAADGAIVSIGGLLDAAERYQLLEQLDRWVIARALEMLAPGATALHAQGAKFAINVTGQSIGQPDFADFLRGAIKASGVPAALLDFELTETAAVRNLKATQRFIARMTEIGAHVALDDFGTGLSSLVHLKDLDVHHIKIDGKFVRDVLSNARSRALIRALVQIADEIGLGTVAEFVESEEIANSVRDLGVKCAQGYFYGRPGPLEAALRDLVGLTLANENPVPTMLENARPKRAASS